MRDPVPWMNAREPGKEQSVQRCRVGNPGITQQHGKQRGQRNAENQCGCYDSGAMPVDSFKIKTYDKIRFGDCFRIEIFRESWSA
jgi:hypothetical protein